MPELLSPPAVGLQWQAQVYPLIRGDVPCSRGHVGAAAQGEYLVVTGGCLPSCAVYQTVDSPHGRVHVLDLKTLRWHQPAPAASKEQYEAPLRVAAADVIRARNRCRDERATALALGARNGQTVEVVPRQCYRCVGGASVW